MERRHIMGYESQIYVTNLKLFNSKSGYWMTFPVKRKIIHRESCLKLIELSIVKNKNLNARQTVKFTKLLKNREKFIFMLATKAVSWSGSVWKSSYWLGIWPVQNVQKVNSRSWGCGGWGTIGAEGHGLWGFSCVSLAEPSVRQRGPQGPHHTTKKQTVKQQIWT